ncbi:succinyldiaminopimelate transaminase [Dermatophilus congolensis]|uniref:succinyldiaminopimelate transaminase n=1 Tax=Dermatophilus congolensis TaxID=1863 RepID=UPI001AAE8F90|nr:succinyldiaminopimelate transaminase [Dermatophilus congolensis]MBO3129703.1 succinyldiaminopimelate transaminase [Dermatophilus congolensis]MBO3131667.1 succinyldiaminopimelate transaminase [Dermatophilus congolensis]MBO3134177.1 succinyldiaminopimelate transaminase [Dermatophilus congolensis]MBO3136411.1 succinyldiaminopimelate transaminase [Dermatophilus congolensis]MBO3138659.1 succinyldiaminopimelate transaminase [Dermatophilus congolensis]
MTDSSGQLVGVQNLPDFPWDSLVPYRKRASEHVGGLVDLSVGTPVDPTPRVVQEALIAAADAPGYPLTYGSGEVRQAVATWFARRRNVPDLDPEAVLPLVGSKELVAWLPTQLGLGPGDVVAFPSLAYPSYDVGARLAGAASVTVDDVAAFDPAELGQMPRLLWVNSPGNPTGKVAAVEQLAALVRWAREHGVIVASDECYAELDWRTPAVGGPTEPGQPATVPSILDPRVCGGSHEGLLAVYSLSKQSNMAGYRAGFLAGDVKIVKALLEVRKHSGMIMPAPVQAAMAAALADDAHVDAQREIYRARRDVLLPAVEAFGFTVDDSEAGLYVWARRSGDCWEDVSALAERGVVVAPGAFYGPAGAGHVRIALTATDERIAAAAARLC